jgi:ABC-type multidrug transport system ATPase subunit
VSTDYATILQNRRELYELTDTDGGITSASERVRRNTIVSGVSSVGGHEPTTLTWKNLNVYVKHKVAGTVDTTTGVWTDKGRQILFNMSGVARPGQLIAIMGASGAGKSTLMNTLTGRNRTGVHIEGGVYVNGRDIGRAITSVSAYVQQDDLFCGTLTVREHLYIQVSIHMQYW